MSKQQQNDLEWEPCPSGELGRLVRRMESEPQRMAVKWATGAVAATALLALLVVGVYRMRQLPGMEYNFGGVTCSEVRARMQQYLAGEIDAELRERLEVHLAKCPQCAKLKQQMMEEETLRTSPNENHLVSTSLGTPLVHVLKVPARHAGSCSCPQCTVRHAHQYQPGRRVLSQIDRLSSHQVALLGL